MLKKCQIRAFGSGKCVWLLSNGLPALVRHSSNNSRTTVGGSPHNNGKEFGIQQFPFHPVFGTLTIPDIIYKFYFDFIIFKNSFE